MVLELLAVNLLLYHRSELFVPEKGFLQTAMDELLDCDFAVAHSDCVFWLHHAWVPKETRPQGSAEFSLLAGAAKPAQDRVRGFEGRHRR